MNTLITVDNLGNQYLAQIVSKTVAFPFVNKSYENELLSQGDTVKVKYMNNITLDTASASWDVITASDWVELSSDLVVDQVKNKNFKIKDIEEIRNSLDVQLKLTELISSAAATNLDKYTLATAIAGAGTVLNSGTALAIDKTNVFAEIENMRVTLDEAGVDNEGQLLFVDAKRASLLRQSDVYTGTAGGLTARERAYIGTISGFEVYQSNNITKDGSDTYMVAFDSNSVHGAEQMNKFKLTDGANSMSANLLFENVFWMSVLWLNSARICASKIVD